LHAPVEGVGHIDVAARVGIDPPHAAERAVARTGAAELCQQLAGGAEPPQRVELIVTDKNVAGGTVDADVVDVSKLCVAPLADEHTFERERLQAMILLVADVNQAELVVDGEAVWVIELAFACACHAPDLERRAVDGEALYAVFVAGDDHDAVWVEVDGARLDELARLSTESAPPADEHRNVAGVSGLPGVPGVRPHTRIGLGPGVGFILLARVGRCDTGVRHQAVIFIGVVRRSTLAGSEGRNGAEREQRSMDHSRRLSGRTPPGIHDNNERLSADLFVLLIYLGAVELTDLRYFSCAAAARSFSRGAIDAHVSPAAISKAIKKIEDELGTPLFVRTTRSVSLTEAGGILFERAKRIFAEVDGARDDIADLGDALAGRLRVGAMEVFSMSLLPRALGDFLAAAPAVVVHCHEMVPERMEPLITDGKLDVGFTVGGGISPRVRKTTLGVSPAVVVVGKRHPLYAQKRVSAADIERHAWVVPRFLGLEHLPPIDQYPDDVLPRRVGVTIELMQMAINLVVEAPLVGTFPAVNVRRAVADGRLRILTSAPVGPSFELNALTAAEAPRRRAVEALIAAVHETVRAEGVR
jgi:DNA-binding transcriptional LysR family regulator